MIIREKSQERVQSREFWESQKCNCQWRCDLIRLRLERIFEWKLINRTKKWQKEKMLWTPIVKRLFTQKRWEFRSIKILTYKNKK